jgi:RND family efflux transporter MFP subunit
MEHRNRVHHFLCAALTWPGLILAGLLLSGCAPEPEAEKVPPLVPAIRLADAESLTASTFPGRARAGQEVNLSFRVTGPLIELPADVGDEFQAGDVVARIDPQDYINALGTATGSLQAAQAQAKKAAADFRRIQNVYKEDPGATSQTAIDLARAARDSSRAAANSLTSAVQAAQDKVNYATLKAPFSGVVVETYVENFETVLAKQPVLRLLDPTSIEFVISVPENMISYAPYVDNAVVTFDALPGVETPATIKEIGREASQATRTYPVTLVMEQPEGAEILPGMAGSAKVSARLPENAKTTGMQLPATAIFALEDPEKSYVWVIDETSKTLQSRAVETGQLTEYGITIRSGLSAGEWVVIKGVHSVKEGQTVRIMDVSGEDAAS